MTFSEKNLKKKTQKRQTQATCETVAKIFKNAIVLKRSSVLKDPQPIKSEIG